MNINKTSISALVIAVLAVVIGGVALFHNSQQTLDGYVPNTQSPAGFIHSLSTSTNLATTDFCSSANTQWLGTTAAVTGTVPAATSTFAQCGFFFGESIAGNIMNDSTNTVTYQGGTGDVFKCETQGAGTSTVQGTCTATGFTILASSTVNYQIFFDSSSSSLVFLVGNNYK